MSVTTLLDEIVPLYMGGTSFVLQGNIDKFLPCSRHFGYIFQVKPGLKVNYTQEYVSLGHAA